MAKTLKKIQSDKKSKCMNTKCKLWLKESRKNLKIFKDALVKQLKRTRRMRKNAK